MKLVISDLTEEQLNQLVHVNDRTVLITDDGSIKPCIGCFGCWVKTPGVCVIPDKYQHLGELFSTCKEMIIISKCVYGGYSPFVKNVMDRGLSYLHPDFEIRNKEMHHKKRYPNTFALSICFYGPTVSHEELLTAKSLAQSNFVNYDTSDKSFYFVKSIHEIRRLNL